MVRPKTTAMTVVLIGSFEKNVISTAFWQLEFCTAGTAAGKVNETINLPLIQCQRRNIFVTY